MNRAIGTLVPRIPLEANGFSNLYVDITERCNMSCNFCYNPERAARDLDPADFAAICDRLPHPVNWRFLGGEPTLHPRFFELVAIALERGHTVYFASNGIKYSDPAFMAELARWSGRLCPGLSMDGGLTRNEVYQRLNNRDCLDIKLGALEGLARHGIRRVCLSAIIARDENEGVIGELLEAARRHPATVRYIHFRSAAQMGRWLDIEPYTLEELKALVRPHVAPTDFAPACVGEINCNGGDGECCYRFRPAPRLQVSLIEFASERSGACPNRGKVLPEEGTIEPFFANMIAERGAS